MIKLILIDFDDTLVQTEAACFELENDIASRLGHLPMTREAHMHNWGVALRPAILERIPGVDVEKFLKLHKKLLPQYVTLGKFDAITQDNLETLQVLHQVGYKVAILTSRTLAEAEHLVHNSHPLANYIDGFYHGDNLEVTKPDPRVFRLPLRHFKIDPHEAVYIGDARKDGECAKAAGLHFVETLESGLLSKADFEHIPVDVCVEHFTQVPAVIEGLV